jgi:deoxyribodipyrimidine photolyase-related protein
MHEFNDQLQALTRPLPAGPRRWVYVCCDQLTDAVGPVHDTPAAQLGIILVESAEAFRRRPYHKQKLALILANQRQFALEQARRGVQVRYIVSADACGKVLAGLKGELGELEGMEPAEWEMRQELAGVVKFLPHAGWLSTTEDFARLGKAPWRMDVFYRHMRRRTGILMDGPQPRGGKWSHDAENRRPWRGEPPAPDLLRFRPDAVTREAGALVEKNYPDHPGSVDLSTLSATKAQAQAAWRWAKRACLPHFGPYEDAMSVHSSNLFHSRVSALVNLHRLLPSQVIDEALALDLPLPSIEGFVRQILGWREFMRHVHVATDGFRHGVNVNPLKATQPLPAVYWGKAPSGLNCLDRVVDDVWREGYSHHITRLMVLSNIATLLGISPRELTDWFWVAYIDAYDWVVEPNVMGMGTYGLGDLFVTKPYVSGAAYIHKMSDYCKGCQFNPAKTCPITPMYWAFMARHREKLEKNPRMGIPLMGLRRRSEAKQAADAATHRHVLKVLGAGEELGKIY